MRSRAALPDHNKENKTKIKNHQSQSNQLYKSNHNHITKLIQKCHRTITDQVVVDMGMDMDMQAGLNGEELGVQYSLYQKIDLENVTCLNEEIENSGKDVFKAWENRKDRTKVIV